MMNNKKGDWIQIFMIIVFAIVVLISFLLLGLQKATLDPVKMESLEQDILDQQAKIVLINWLRTPTNVELAKSADETRADMASFIATTTPSPKIDEKLVDLLWSNSIPGYYLLNIKYEFDENDYNDFLTGELYLLEPDAGDYRSLGQQLHSKDLPDNTYYTTGWLYTPEHENKRDIGTNDCSTYTGAYQRKDKTITTGTFFFEQTRREAKGEFGRAQVILPSKTGNVLVQLEHVDSVSYDQWRAMGGIFLRLAHTIGFLELQGGDCDISY